MLTGWAIFERSIPWACLVAGGAIAFCCSAPGDIYKVGPQVLPSAIAVSAIFGGFQATVHAYLTSTATQRIVKMMREFGQFEVLVSYVRTALAVNVLFVSVAFITQWVLASEAQMCPLLQRSVLAAIAGLFALALSASYRVMHAELMLLRLRD